MWDVQREEIQRFQSPEITLTASLTASVKKKMFLYHNHF